MPTRPPFWSRFWAWLHRADPETDIQRAKVSLIALGIGGLMGLVLAIWSALAHQLPGALEGIGLVGMAVSIYLRP